jgi:hypothetical protein
MKLNFITSSCSQLCNMNRIFTFLSVCAIYPIFASINNQSTDLMTNETIDFDQVIDPSSLNRSTTNQTINQTINHTINHTINQSNRSINLNSHLAVVSGNFTCNPGKLTKECSYHGICQDNGKNCVCNDGYISSQPSSDNVQCDYKQKDTLIAFLLEFFLGEFGGGYFYLGLIPLGVGRLCFFILGMIPIIFIVCVGVLTDSDVCIIVFATCYSCLWTIGVIGWWIASMVMIANGTILDGNGMPIPAL